jgi:transposase
MVVSAGMGLERRRRRRHPVSEKQRIVELTFAPGASVAQIAQAHGVNANQVFNWRRAFERGELLDLAASSTALLPVTVTAPCEAAKPERSAQEQPATAGSIHIEFPGLALIRVESGADPALLGSILEGLRK